MTLRKQQLRKSYAVNGQNLDTPANSGENLGNEAFAKDDCPSCHHTVVDLPVAALKPHPRNARRHSKQQIKQIAASIRQFGFTFPVLIDASKHIIAGHGRVAAAKLLGLTHVPTIEITHLNDTEIRAYMIADNRLSDLSDWNNELLDLELSAFVEMPQITIDVLGFDPSTAIVPTKKTKRKTKSKSPRTPISHPGEEWLLGCHRLICGNKHLEQADALIEVFETATGETAVLEATGEPFGSIAHAPNVTQFPASLVSQ